MMVDSLRHTAANLSCAHAGLTNSLADQMVRENVS
jgi:hypothetical protein